MPLPIAHGLVGAGLVKLIHPNVSPKDWKSLLIGFVVANLADFDFVFVFLFGWKNFHRGITHSLAFAILVSLIFFILLRNKDWRIPLAYSAAFLSHTILDFIFAKYGGGVRLFIPFDDNSYRLGILSFSELTRGFHILDMFYFSIIEILIFFPIFLLVITLKTRFSQNI